MMGMMGAVMLIGLLLLAILIGVAVYLAIRAAQPRSALPPSPRDRLQERLAAGEITPEEYYERESVLRDGEATTPRRRR
jgi:uncharacterized membrane protein